MELTNATRMVAGYTMGTDPSAREHIVVVVKGTFRLPRHATARSPPRRRAGAARDGRHLHGRARLLRAGPRGRLPAPQAPLRHPPQRHRLRPGRPPGTPRARRREGRRLVQGHRRGRRPRLAPGGRDTRPLRPRAVRHHAAHLRPRLRRHGRHRPGALRRLHAEPGRPRLWPRPLGRAPDRPPAAQHRGRRATR